MPIYNIFIINRAGSLIYDYDNRVPNQEVELQFNYPVDFKFDIIDNRVTVIFGERDNVRVGYIVTNYNNESVLPGGRLAIPTSNLAVQTSVIRSPSETSLPAVLTSTEKSEFLLEVLSDPNRYPVTLKFIKPSLNTNEKIILSSMFHSLHAIGAQLSPVMKSSGIEILDTDTFRLQCFQTITGMKFLVVADSTTPNLDQFLRKLYELYADYATKNPFYSMEMPIRCELFDSNLKIALEKFEKSGVVFV